MQLATEVDLPEAYLPSNHERGAWGGVPVPGGCCSEAQARVLHTSRLGSLHTSLRACCCPDPATRYLAQRHVLRDLRGGALAP
jgi:hypothetical protein